MKKIILFLTILGLISCEKRYKEIVKYDTTGTVVTKSYLDSNQKLDSLIQYENKKVVFKMYFNKLNTNYCYVNQFDYRGKLNAEGNYVNKIKIGKWIYYNSKMKTKKIVQYINLCGSEYPNQVWTYNDQDVLLNNIWVFDAKDSLSKNLSSYYNYKLDNTKILKDKSYELEINYVSMLKTDHSEYVPKLNSSHSILIMSPDFDKNFCNITDSKIKKDTLGSYPLQNHWIINIKFASKGRKYFRGFIEEYWNEKGTKKGYVQPMKKRTYINIPIFVN